VVCVEVALGTRLRAGGLELGGLARGDDHARARLHEAAGDHLADAARPARHQSSLARDVEQLAHQSAKSASRLFRNASIASGTARPNVLMICWRSSYSTAACSEGISSAVQAPRFVSRTPHGASEAICTAASSARSGRPSSPATPAT